MEHLVFIVLSVLIIVLTSGISGFFYSRYTYAKSKVRDLRKQKETHLDPLMSSDELSDVASKLVRLREKAKRMRDS